MSSKQLLDEILGILHRVKDDKNKLEQIHEFLMEEIYEKEEEEEIPEKYKKAVAKITDGLLAGFICYFNPKTLEVEEVPEMLLEDPDEFEATAGETEGWGKKHEAWENCFEFSPMDSNESFHVMERFVDTINDARLRDKLIYALNNKKPFANFKYQAENSDYREEWFVFRKKQWEQYVWRQMQDELDLNS